MLGLGGAATVILARSTIAAESVFGIICAIGALAGITGGTLWEKRFGISLHPVVSNLIQFAAGLVTTLPFALALETLTIDWTWDFIAALAYLVIGNSLIAMTLSDRHDPRRRGVARLRPLLSGAALERAHGLAVARRAHAAARLGRHGAGGIGRVDCEPQPAVR